MVPAPKPGPMIGSPGNGREKPAGSGRKKDPAATRGSEPTPRTVDTLGFPSFSGEGSVVTLVSFKPKVHTNEILVPCCTGVSAGSVASKFLMEI